MKRNAGSLLVVAAGLLGVSGVLLSIELVRHVAAWEASIVVVLGAAVLLGMFAAGWRLRRLR